MSSQIEEVVRETEEALKSMLPKDQWDEIDLSYITQELIAEGEQKSVEKTQEEVKKHMEGFPHEPANSAVLAYCFMGHHLYRTRDGYWHWQNGNPDDGCDTLRFACDTGYYWKYKLRTAVRINCPRQAGGFAGN